MKRLRKKITAVLLVFLISIIGTLALFFLFINLPLSQKFVTRKVNQIFVHADLPIRVSTIMTVRLSMVKLEGFDLYSLAGDTIIHVEHVKAHYSLPALLNHRVVVKKLDISGATVRIIKKEAGASPYTIATAFSGKDNPGTVQPEKEKSKWEIIVHKGDLRRVVFQMNDPGKGIQIYQKAEELALKSFRLSLPENSIILNTTDLRSAVGKVTIAPGQHIKKSKSGVPWSIGLGRIKLADVDLSYDQSIDSLFLNLVLQEGLIRTNGMDLSNQQLDMDLVSLKGATATLLTAGPSNNHKGSDRESGDSFLWDLAVNKTDLEQINLSLGLYESTWQRPAMPTYDVAGLEMRLADARLSKTITGVVVKKLEFGAKSGFKLRHLTGSLDSDPESTRLELVVDSENSHIELEGQAEESFFGMIENPQLIHKAIVSLRNSRLSLSDFIYFREELQEVPVLNTLAKVPINIGGELGLDNSRIHLSDMTVSQGQNFGIHLEGYANNVFQPAKATGLISFNIEEADIDWIKGIVEGAGVDQDLSALTSLSVEGTLSNAFRAPDLQLRLQSNLGKVVASGSLDLTSDLYAAELSFEGLKPGTFLNVESLGPISGSGSLDGAGFDPASMLASLSMKLDSLAWNGYGIRGTRIESQMSHGILNVDVLVDDPILKTDLEATLNITDTALRIDASATLFAQLDEWNLWKDTLSLRSSVKAGFSKKGGAFETDISLEDMEFATPGKEASVRAFSATFNTDSVHTEFKGSSDFFTADIRIDKPLGELGATVEDYGNYLSSFVDSIHESISLPIDTLPDMSASCNIEYHEILELLMNDSALWFSDLAFSLGNKSPDHNVHYYLTGEGLRYNDLRIGEVEARVIDSAGVLTVKLLTDHSQVGASSELKFLIDSEYEQWQSLTDLSVLNQEGALLYKFGITSELESGRVNFKIPSRQLIMNQNRWKLESPDLISYNLASGKIFPNLKMFTDSALVHLSSSDIDGSHYYHCDLRDVSFGSNLQRSLIPGDPEGIITGAIHYGIDQDSVRRFDTNLQIRHVSWSGLSFNEISLDGALSAGGAGAYEIDLSASLDSSEVTIKGERSEGGIRNLSAGLYSVPISTFQTFVRDYLSDMDGLISGEFSILPGPNGDIFRGDLQLDNAALRINTLNSKYQIPGERITFSGNRMVLTNFQILDSLNNPLLLNGFVEFNKDREHRVDLLISSTKLQVMNRQDQADNPFYGEIYVDSHLSFKGPLSKPVIKGRIVLSAGTEIFYRQMEDLTKSESENIVSFVEQAPVENPGTEASVERLSGFIESSIETIVQIDPTTRINFNLSKRIYTIDLMIAGGGTLNYQMLNQNQMALTGEYDIREGAAELKLVGWPNKSFSIKEGGYIRWEGNIENPELKFEALNTVRGSYTNPVDGMLRDVDFIVNLELSNKLSDLDVLFTVETNDQYLMSIINTLSKEEMMRQAITILLFETIDLPGISSSTDYMTQQVNQLVATQLNSLTKTTIKGVDISFGVDSYVQATESGGEETRTSLSYDVSKTMLNERGQLELSGRFNDVNSQPGASDLSLNNISFEYRLDSAATRYLKVYNEHTYEDVFEGEIIKTGIGITFRKRYRILSDIWRREKKNGKSGKEQP
ncbi:MAG: hypothetical protein GY790_19105 [Bacteroidetes bacterium]|nr:hypothetical protein [Bacteroidota bacterium]